MCKKKRKWARLGTCSLSLGALVLGGLLFGAQAAYAADSGPTTTGDVCMQHVFGDPVTNSNKLNCTANDIQLSRAISVSPGSCIEGETFTLTATFETIVTANARYDAGFFFRIDGGSNARGDGVNADGTCSLSRLALPAPAGSPALNLDGDTCGDLNAGTYNVTFTIPGVTCVGVPDPQNPGKKILKLPNCTSWHSNQATSCSINDLQNGFDPDTKSKCVCDDTFTVPVIVEDATLNVVKTAAPTTVPETGGTVTYTVNVTNQASFVSVTIATLVDDIYGNLHTTNPNVTDNTCPNLVGVVLGPGASTSCSFKAFVSGDTGQTVTDVVEVCVTQNNTGSTICGDDDADVTITDVPSTPSLVKTALSAACTVDVTYQVVVNNNSTIDTLTVNSLTDDKFGNITTVHAAGGGFKEVVSTTCATGGTIATSDNYTCSFVGRIDTGTGACSIDHTNRVTGNVTDDDGVNSTPSDTATVTVTTVFP
jgi:hypothetical protein